MRSSRRSLLCHALGGILAAGASRGLAADSRHPFLVGTGKAPITPPLEVGILMSSGRRRWEPFQQVRLPIWARAVHVSSGDQQVALVSVDLLGLADAAVGGMQRFMRQVAQVAGGTLSPEQIVLTATHTHSGPEALALTDLFETRPFQDWVALLAKQIGLAIAQAAQAARPCRMLSVARSVPGLCVNRRVLTDKGVRNPLRIPPGETLLRPEGPVDDQVRMAAFVDSADRPAAILVNATAHPVYEMCIQQVSPDYPGEMCLELERLRPGAGVMFFQGTAGNINPPEVSTGDGPARQHGQRLARAVDEMLADSRPTEAAGLALVRETLALPCRDERGTPQDAPLEVQISALRVGQAAWVFLPGEPFVEIGLGICRASPFPQTAVVGYSHAYVGYLPTDTAFANKGYETGPGRWSRFLPGVETQVCDAALRLLGRLA